jgi:hypothetical protein
MILEVLWFSAGALESLALACRLPVDPREQHGKLRGLEFDAILSDRLRHLEASYLSRLYQMARPSRSK